ncbi:Neugrin [Geosmithia morbida]|uniref:Required for respiratory growth protein 9, mitochondrial n=1 Tax=Geosmithia morbida TaxID=1094350 RepID=A0A9P5D1B1_9HYPO|nr:Neugrin [Geosmithia morbida]KAF4123693.1 Neugrin [Geosmithia morbida]
MSCSCRTVPLRTFLSGLAQVHRLEGTAAAPIPPVLARLVRPTPTRLTAAAGAGRLISARLFHHSPRFLQQHEKSPRQPPQEQEQEHRDGASSDASADEHRKQPQEGARGSATGGVDLAEGRARPVHGGTTTTTTSRHAPSNMRHVKRTRGAGPSIDGTSGDKPFRSHRPPQKSRNSSSSSSSSNERDGGRHGEDEAPPAGKVENWRVQKEALKTKFPEGWRPRKRLSPDALAGIRALNAQFPEVYTTQTLSDKFEVSPENIRRILKSRWRPSEEEEEDRRERWERRGRSVWEMKAALGVKPPRRWREEGIVRDPSYHVRRSETAQRERSREEDDKDRYRTHRARVNRSNNKI